MKPKLVPLILCLLAAAVFPQQGWSKKKIEAPVDPKFLAIGKVTVLPVVDARSGKKTGVNFDSLRKKAVEDLKRKGYPVETSDTTGVASEIADEDLQDAKPEWAKRLGPQEARWVMVIELRDSHTKVGATSKITIGETSNVEVLGFLFDKRDGSQVWNGTGVGQSGTTGGPGVGGGLIGGAVGMAFTPLDRSQAFDSAILNLLASIPKLPKGYEPGSQPLPEAVAPPAPAQPAKLETNAPVANQAAAQSPANIMVQIESDPSGADIEIDGNFVGNSPSTVGVAPGAHQIVLKKKGFSDWTTSLTATGGNPQVKAVLVPVQPQQ
jgi:hypothetical protein